MKTSEDKGLTSNVSRENIRIASVAVATPPFRINQAEAGQFLAKHYADKLSPRNLAIMRKIFAHPGIIHRHLAVNNLACLVNEHPDSRITRFTQWAISLSSQAITKTLNQAGLDAKDVSGLVVNTCTGYICPGLSTYLIEKLGLSDRIRAYDLVGSGCGGAVPNLQICKDIVNTAGDGVVLSVSVEICSATFQMSDDLSLIISNAIFADGASATVLWNRPAGLTLEATASRYDPKYRDALRYVYKEGQLHNQLSASLPDLASKAVARVVIDLLKRKGLRIDDIKHWAFHPGGEKIINAIKRELGLSENQLQVTRNVLAGYGNMSSPSVLFVLREILDKGVMPGEWCVIVAFGAGLCAHALLLRA